MNQNCVCQRINLVVLRWEWPPLVHMFEYVVPSWWKYLGRIRRCGLVGGAISLAGWAKAHVVPHVPLYVHCLKIRMWAPRCPFHYTLAPSPWTTTLNQCSQPVATVPMGVAYQYPSYQVFAVWLITVAKFQSWPTEKIIVWLGITTTWGNVPKAVLGRLRATNLNPKLN